MTEHRLPNPRRIIRRGVITVPLIIAALAITLTGFFAPEMPLWLAGLPLIAAIVVGSPRARAGAMAAFLLWPIIASASALVTLGYSAIYVWPLAALALMSLATAAAGIGLTPLAILLTLIAVFPASPVLLIADAVPGSGLIGPMALLIGLGLTEAIPHRWQRGASVLMLAAATLAWGQLYQSPDPPEVAWQVHPEPRMITERGRWIALRDSLPPGAQAILGENIFAASNHEAAAFWCDAARSRTLTLWIGVQGQNERGQIWRFDPTSCAPPAGRAVIVHAARYGIPGLTGTWGAMDPIAGSDPSAGSGPSGDTDLNLDTGLNAATEPAWLICFEAFLPWAWRPVLTAMNSERPIVILSNDRAFGRWPISTLRRKVSRAMARLTGRAVVHAETGRHILVKSSE